MNRLTIIRAVATLWVAMLLGALSASGQRHITPSAPPAGVNENKNAPRFDRSNVKEITDANGQIILVDTVLGTEVVDTTVITKVIGNKYPLLHSIGVSVNAWDGVMRILGQQYGLVGFRGDINLHNRYKPYLEIGLSKADFTPDGNNYTFHSGIAPYFKIGAGYNIFYNSNPDYQLCFNLGYGFSAFSYSYNNITVDEGYWNDPSHFSLPSQNATVGYLEVGASLKVKLAGPISAGWQVVYHTRLHENANRHGPPVIIPGYGKRDGSLGISLFVTYTIPFKNNQPISTTPNQEE